MQARELPLIALRAFAVAARASSLKAAAIELGVTHGAISKQISSLEGWLGQRMFTREGRRLVLTPYGRILAEKLGQSINEIRGACEYVQRQKNRFVVSVEAPTTFAMYWLLPHLPEFHKSHPDISVWTATRQTGQSPDYSGTDIVITRESSADFSPRLCESEVLFEERLTVISSPSLLAKKSVKRPADVLHHRLITAATRPGEWESWLNMVGVDHQILEGGYRFDHLFVAIHAVRDGLGLIIAPKDLFAVSFAKKELSAPLPKITLRGASYVAHRTLQAEGKHVKVFMNWLHHLVAPSSTKRS